MWRIQQIRGEQRPSREINTIEVARSTPKEETPKLKLKQYWPPGTDNALGEVMASDSKSDITVYVDKIVELEEINATKSTIKELKEIIFFIHCPERKVTLG